MNTAEISDSFERQELFALRAEKAARDRIANRIPAMVGYWNSDLICEFANEAYVEWFGLTPDSAIGMHLRDLLGERLFKLNEGYARKALAGEEQRFEREIRKPDGSVGYTDARYIPDADPQGVIRGFVVLVSDITELHHAYAKIRELAQRLEVAREDERRSLASVLHEGIAQDLFAMKLEIDHWIATAGGRAGIKACRALSGAASKCMSDLREIANGLRPAALAHLRVRVAIEEYVHFFQKRSNLQISVSEAPQFPTLDESRRLLLYRAAQEALTNVARHAKASTVRIELSSQGPTVKLEVVDDGVGIQAGELEKPGSLGILGLRERVRALGGDLSVTMTADAGTRFSVQVPVS